MHLVKGEVMAMKNEPQVVVTVDGRPSKTTTLKTFLSLIALTDDESNALIAGDSVALVRGFRVELVKS